MIRLERAYDDPGPDDTYRVLVDRLWPRGVKKEKLRLDRWMKEVAPSNELRKWVHEDPDDRWEEFRERYARELADRQEEVAFLLSKARDPGLTLIYAARDRERNNAVALRDHLLGDGDGDRDGGPGRRKVEEAYPAWKQAQDMVDRQLAEEGADETEGAR